MIKRCVVCGSEFSVPKSQFQHVTCSKECSIKHRNSSEYSKLRSDTAKKHLKNGTGWGSPEVQKRRKQACSGENSWMKTPEGRKFASDKAAAQWKNPITRNRMINGLRGSMSEESIKALIERTKKRNTENNPMKCPEVIKKISGKNNSSWRGGISFEPYCPKFNKEFKERVREFFGRVCVECGKNEEENGMKLPIHHVNYDKMVCCNSTKPIFVALCNSHNSKANRNREYWEDHYTDIVNNKYGGQCYLPKEV